MGAGADLPNLTPTHRKLIGFWKLINLERRTAKGEVSSTNPGMTGFLVYTASGHVMVHMMDPYRRRNAGVTPTADETMATYRSYTSYFGPYTVDEPGGYVATTSPPRSTRAWKGPTSSGSPSFPAKDWS